MDRRPVIRRPRRAAGFTIVEVMTGLAVLSIAFASVYVAFGRGFAMVAAARDNTHVAQILQSEIENLRTLSWADIQALGKESKFEPKFDGPGLNIERFACRREIIDRHGDQKFVRLVVTWNSRGGVSHQREYATLFTRGGLNDYYTRAF
jgi:prepilin-type N-terminal cleavage/methylation domain-containing protein